ncbi:MAG: hypothetical protein AAF639_14435 [Chloroflexota bacterium]
MPYVESGDIRTLATLAANCLAPPLDAIPTARELDVDAEWVLWRGLYAPGRMSHEAYAFWVNALEQLAKSDAWDNAASQTGLDPLFMIGEAHAQMVAAQVANFRQLSIDVGIVTE